MVLGAEANPNIILPALFSAFVGAMVAIPGIIAVLRSNKRTRESSERVHDEVRTNHGMRAGEYIEMIGPLVDWANAHTEEDNELRKALGMEPGKRPEVPEK